MSREELFHRYWDELEDRICAMVYRYGFRLEREDALQEAALLLWLCLGDFVEEKQVPFQGYYMAKLRFHLMDLGRRVKSCTSLDVTTAEDVTLLDLQEDDGPSPEDDVCRSECQRALRRTLSQLSPRERQVLYLVDGEGLKMTEVAKGLGLKHRTVINARRRALTKARRLMKEWMKEERDRC